MAKHSFGYVCNHGSHFQSTQSDRGALRSPYGDPTEAWKLGGFEKLDTPAASKPRMIGDFAIAKTKRIRRVTREPRGDQGPKIPNS